MNLYCVINMSMFYTSIVVNVFDFKNLTIQDYGIIASIFISTNLYAVLFGSVNKSLDHEVFSEAKGIFELKQY
jgi:hypothetical protein